MLLPFLFIVALFKGVARLLRVPVYAVFAAFLFGAFLLFGQDQPPVHHHHGRAAYAVAYVRR